MVFLFERGKKTLGGHKAVINITLKKYNPPTPMMHPFIMHKGNRPCNHVLYTHGRSYRGHLGHEGKPFEGQHMEWGALGFPTWTIVDNTFFKRSIVERKD